MGKYKVEMFSHNPVLPLTDHRIATFCFSITYQLISAALTDNTHTKTINTAMDEVVVVIWSQHLIFSMQCFADLWYFMCESSSRKKKQQLHLNCKQLCMRKWWPNIYVRVWGSLLWFVWCSASSCCTWQWYVYLCEGSFLCVTAVAEVSKMINM